MNDEYGDTMAVLANQGVHPRIIFIADIEEDLQGGPTTVCEPEFVSSSGPSTIHEGPSRRVCFEHGPPDPVD